MTPIARNGSLAILGALAFVAFWELAAIGYQSGLLAAPSTVLLRLMELSTKATIWNDLVSTTGRWLAGFALGCAVGIPLGLVMGAYRPVYSSLSLVLDFLGSLPVTAIFPLFLLVFGIGDASKVAMVFTATVFVVASGTAFGVMHATTARVRMARTFGATEWQVFRHVLAYEALPQIIVSMRSTLSISLIAVVVSEMFIGTESGLGQRIYVAYQTNVTADLYAVLLVVGCLGYTSTALLDVLERRLVPWAGL